jgi:hypothetical protein
LDGHDIACAQTLRESGLGPHGYQTRQSFVPLGRPASLQQRFEAMYFGIAVVRFRNKLFVQ